MGLLETFVLCSHWFTLLLYNIWFQTCIFVSFSNTREHRFGVRLATRVSASIHIGTSDRGMSRSVILVETLFEFFQVLKLVKSVLIRTIESRGQLETTKQT